MADDRPQYQHGVGTIGDTSFHWGSGTPGSYWSIPYGDYPVTPNAPTGDWAHKVGAISIANNVIPDPQLGRNRIGIMIHSGSAPALDQLYTEGCFKVAPQEWPAVRQQILTESQQAPLYLHVAPGGVAAFTHTATMNGTPAVPAVAPAAAAINSANASASVTPNPFSVDPQSRDLAIRTIIGEAGGESADGQAGVASVLKNRLASGQYGKDLESVIYAPKQFSLWNPGDPAGKMALAVDANSDQYKNVGKIFDGVMSGDTPDPTGGATHYYNPKNASPDWGDQLAQQNDVTIGNHRFVGTGASGPGSIAPSGPGRSPTGPATTTTPAVASGPPTSVGDALTKLTQEGQDSKGAATASPLEKLGAAFAPKQQQASEHSAPMLQAPQDNSAMLAGPAQQLMQQVMASGAKPLSWQSTPYGSGAAGPLGTTLNSYG